MKTHEEMATGEGDLSGRRGGEGNPLPVVKKPRVLIDVLHIVSAHFAVEGNAAVGICREAWRDERIWMAIIDMKHTPKDANGEVDMEASRLVIASRNGRLENVKKLLDLGANIEGKSTNGNTALSLACMYGHEHVASFLLDRDANIDALNIYNLSALYLACRNANVEAARLLLARGANVDLGDPPILAAIQDSHEEEEQMDCRLQLVCLLADHNANLKAVDEDGLTALMLAIRYSQAAVIEFLLDRDANIDELNNDNESALYLACFYANVEAARLLIARGANVDLGDPPILAACRSVHKDDRAEVDMSTFWARRLLVVQLLADNNANLNAVNVAGNTALMIASHYNRAAIIELLLNRHVDIDALNNHNLTALNMACYWASVESARLLLEHGANVDLGIPPILDAGQYVQEDETEQVDMSTFWARRLLVVRLLIDHNANLNVFYPDGCTALILASRNNQAAIVELLLDRHVDIDALNTENESALCYACHFANVDIVRLLLARGANVNFGRPPILAACAAMHEDYLAQVGMSTFWARRGEIVIELVLHSADLEVVDADGDGPLDLAEVNEQWAIVAVLRKVLGMSDVEEKEEKEEEMEGLEKEVEEDQEREEQKDV